MTEDELVKITTNLLADLDGRQYSMLSYRKDAHTVVSTLAPIIRAAALEEAAKAAESPPLAVDDWVTCTGGLGVHWRIAHIESECAMLVEPMIDGEPTADDPICVPLSKLRRIE